MVINQEMGLVIKPLIFIMYVNDILGSAFHDKDIYTYVDDMLIMSQDEDIDIMRHSIQGKLDFVIKWCTFKLTVNDNKTKFMVVS